MARGMFLQHRGRPDEAVSLLEEAADLLSFGHPDLMPCLSHLQALRAGLTSCCTESADEAFSMALTSFVKRQVPGDLVQRVTFRLPPGGIPDVNVATSRQPTEREAEEVKNAIKAGITTLAKAASRSGTAR